MASMEKSGELTAIGMRQHYVLGIELRQRYGNFIPSSFDSKRIRCSSTDVHRTIMSANAQLYALFTVNSSSDELKLRPEYNESYALPPTNLTTVHEELHKFALPMNFQPIPVHVESGRYDNILQAFMPSVCPYMKQLASKQRRKILANSEFLNESRPWVSEAIKNGWIPERNPSSSQALTRTSYLFDVIVADYYEGIDIPIKKDNKHWRQFKYMYNVFHHTLYNGDPLQWQLSSTNFLNQVLTYFRDKAEGNATEEFLLYSCHDSNLVSILTAFNQINLQCIQKGFHDGDFDPRCSVPNYASTIFFELWIESENSSDVAVRVIYNDVPLYLCGADKEFCTLDEFAEAVHIATGGLTEDDYIRICNYGPDSDPSDLPNTSASVLKVGLTILALVLAGLLLVNTKRKVVDIWRSSN